MLSLYIVFIAYVTINSNKIASKPREYSSDWGNNAEVTHNWAGRYQPAKILISLLPV